MSQVNNEAIYAVLKQAVALTLDEQRVLNSLLVENLKRQRKVEGARIASKLNIGDEVVFDAGPRKGIVKIRVESFSRDGSKLKGPQLGGFRPGCMWTVAAQLVNKA